MKTYTATVADSQNKKWFIIDAEGLIVGRVASLIAMRLRGKHKAIFTPNMDTGDNVIVINAQKIIFTGKKRDDKRYYWHTGHPGGIKDRKAHEILDGRFPTRVMHKAVERMMPGGPLSRVQMKHLHIYADSEHPHEAQKPEVLDIKAMNPKNSLRPRTI